MSIRTAEAIWEGTLKDGQGRMKLGSGAFDGEFTWASRFAEGQGTNPEELIGAAHAGCFSMFLSAQLTNAGYVPASIQTAAAVDLGSDDVGPKITMIQLSCEARVPEIDPSEFHKWVQISKENCPVSRALAATEFKVTAKLLP